MERWEGGFDDFLIYEGLGKKEGGLVFLYIYIYYIYIIYICIYIYISSARIGTTWNKFRELSGMLVRKQGLSLKQAGKICVLC